MSEFYEQLASLYHLIYSNWDESLQRQASHLGGIIREAWPDAITILDVSCGIGTQAIGLAKEGYSVTASDLSDAAVARARNVADFLTGECTAPHTCRSLKRGPVLRIPVNTIPIIEPPWSCAMEGNCVSCAGVA